MSKPLCTRGCCQRLGNLYCFGFKFEVPQPTSHTLLAAAMGKELGPVFREFAKGISRLGSSLLAAAVQNEEFNNEFSQMRKAMAEDIARVFSIPSNLIRDVPDASEVPKLRRHDSDCLRGDGNWTDIRG